MNFYSTLKYILMALFLAVIIVASLNLSDESATKAPNATQSQPQSKFNL